MIYLLAIGIIILFIALPFLRCVLANIFKAFYYAGLDVYKFIKYKKWQDWEFYVKESGISNYIGMFGHGKSLSMTVATVNLYNHFAKFGKTVRVISNYEFKTIPYIPLVNFQQIVDLSSNPSNDYVGTVVCITEIETLLNNRKFADFPLEMLHSICQQRKLHIIIYADLQRWTTCDKNWRILSNYAIDCKKLWRFQNNVYYDAFDYENATDIKAIRPKSNKWWFVTNKHYGYYDSFKCVVNSNSKDFISNDERLQRLALDTQRNNDLIIHKKRSRKTARHKV